MATATEPRTGNVVVRAHTKAILCWPLLATAIVFLLLNLLFKIHGGWMTWTFGIMTGMTLTVVIHGFKRDLVLWGGLAVVLILIILAQQFGLEGFKQAFELLGKVDATYSMLMMSIIGAFTALIVLRDMIDAQMKAYTFDGNGITVKEWGKEEQNMRWEECEITCDDTEWDDWLIAGAGKIIISRRGGTAPIVIENVINVRSVFKALQHFLPQDR